MTEIDPNWKCIVLFKQTVWWQKSYYTWTDSETLLTCDFDSYCVICTIIIDNILYSVSVKIDTVVEYCMCISVYD